MNDFFKARDVLKVGDKDYVIYRLDALEKAGSHEPQAASVFDPGRARGRTPSMQRQRDHAERCEEHRRLDAQRRSPRDSVFTCACRHAGFHGSASSGGPGRHARGGCTSRW